jgi:hypothetical protein
MKDVDYREILRNNMLPYARMHTPRGHTCTNTLLPQNFDPLRAEKITLIPQGNFKRLYN